MVNRLCHISCPYSVGEAISQVTDDWRFPNAAVYYCCHCFIVAAIVLVNLTTFHIFEINN